MSRGGSCVLGGTWLSAMTAGVFRFLLVSVICSKKFASAVPHARVLLATYPNSGTTLALHSISLASGVATEAIYRESTFKTPWGTWAHTHWARAPGDNDTSVIKTHKPDPTQGYLLPLKKKFDFKVIKLERNLVDNMYANWGYYTAVRNCLGQPDICNKGFWSDFCKAQRWMYLQYHCRWNKALSLANIPTLVISYEELSSNQTGAIGALKKMLDFSGRPYTEESVTAAVKEVGRFGEGPPQYPKHKYHFSKSLLESTSAVAGLARHGHCDVVALQAEKVLKQRDGMCSKAFVNGCKKCDWQKNIQFLPTCKPAEGNKGAGGNGGKKRGRSKPSQKKKLEVG
mmetsp:Transcript_27718/g.60567  ORF Transcript_27718/g.60567 Transcript_27718/m.60567 type:complete len:342 (-) Transcript_27718:94-1119(-)